MYTFSAEGRKEGQTGPNTSRGPITNPEIMMDPSKVVNHQREVLSLNDDVSEAKAQILIVDDDLLNRFALKTLLQLCNLDVNS